VNVICRVTLMNCSSG